MIILGIFFLFYGFSFYALAIQCFGQYVAAGYVNALYEQSIISAERDRRRMEHIERRKNGSSKSSKAKKGKRR